MSSSGAEWPGPGQYYSKWSRYFLDINLSWNIFTNPLPTGSLLAPGSGQASSSLRSSSPSHLLPGIEFLYLSCMCREPPLTRASGSVETVSSVDRETEILPPTTTRYFISDNNTTILQPDFITKLIATFQPILTLHLNYQFHQVSRSSAWGISLRLHGGDSDPDVVQAGGDGGGGELWHLD